LGHRLQAGSLAQDNVFCQIEISRRQSRPAEGTDCTCSESPRSAWNGRCRIPELLAKLIAAEVHDAVASILRDTGGAVCAGRSAAGPGTIRTQCRDGKAGVESEC